MRPRWSSGPEEILLVRHGESMGNLADARARDAGAEQLELDDRDADVELTDTGRRQADALNAWLAGDGASSLPTAAISSPYRRAADTAYRALDGHDVDVVLDERLRERDLGLFDGLTTTGVGSRHPEEAERRRKLGKFYYQPPSGESWADVVLRVRSLLQDLREGYDGGRLWLFTHQAVIMSFRYVLEDFSEQDLLDLDREVQIPNTSITSYRRSGDLFELEGFADTTAVDKAEADVTREPSQGGRGDEQA